VQKRGRLLSITIVID